jgi:hypothetical protein
MQDYSWVPTQAGGAMSGRNIVKLITDEARTKPVIADLIQRAVDMTDEDFAQLATPLPWHKKALVEMRRALDAANAQKVAEGYVEAMGDVVENKPQRGAVVRHTGPEVSITPPPRIGRPMAMLVKTGDILFVTRDTTWSGSFALGHPSIPCEVIERDASREDYFRHYERNAPSMDLRGDLPHQGEMHPSGLFSVIRSV